MAILVLGCMTPNSCLLGPKGPYALGDHSISLRMVFSIYSEYLSQHLRTWVSVDLLAPRKYGPAPCSTCVQEIIQHNLDGEFSKEQEVMLQICSVYLFEHFALEMF